MKILIIGSEGFIGGNAVKYFTSQGFEVFGADIVTRKSGKYSVINPEFPDFKSIFKQQSFDVCINASGTANVQFSFENSFFDYTLNVTNVFHILDAIRQFNPGCKFINFSSAAVYGNPEVLPVKEDSELKPMSPYGFHKMQSEQICREFYSSCKIPTLSMRVFSAYGPGLKKQLFWDLYQKSLSGKQIELFGTGDETRDFIYIDDIMHAIELLILKHPFNGSEVNIANGEEITIREVSSLFLKMLVWKGNLIFNNEIKIGDPRNWKSDISIISKLGYKKVHSIREGLVKYIEWLKE